MPIQPWNQISCFQEAWHTFLVSGSQFLPWRSVGVHFSDFVSGAVSRHANVLLVPIVQYLNQMFQSTVCIQVNVSVITLVKYLNQMFQGQCMMHTCKCFCDSTCAVFWTKCFRACVCVHGNISVITLVQYFEPNLSRHVYAYIGIFLWLHLCSILNQMFQGMCMHTWEYFCGSTCAVFEPNVQLETFTISTSCAQSVGCWKWFRYCGKWAMWK